VADMAKTVSIYYEQKILSLDKFNFEYMLRNVGKSLTSEGGKGVGSDKYNF
jgi:hypothetical protein